MFNFEVLEVLCAFSKFYVFYVFVGSRERCNIYKGRPIFFLDIYRSLFITRQKLSVFHVLSFIHKRGRKRRNREEKLELQYSKFQNLKFLSDASQLVFNVSS